MFTSNFTDLENPLLFYDIDTTGGQSGSPIYNDQVEVVGVHSNGGIKQTGNHGQRLNEVNYNFIVNRVNEEEKNVYPLCQQRKNHKILGISRITGNLEYFVFKIV